MVKKIKDIFIKAEDQKKFDEAKEFESKEGGVENNSHSSECYYCNSPLTDDEAPNDLCTSCSTYFSQRTGRH